MQLREDVGLVLRLDALGHHLQAQAEYNLAHLGTYLTAAGVELANQAVTLPAPPSGRPTPQAFFSLYVRNNNVDQSVIDGDPLTDARQDDDAIVNLVAVGWVQFGNTVRAGTAIQGLAAGTRDAQAAGGRGAGVAMKAAK